MKRYFHNELQDIRTKLILIGEKAKEAGTLAIDGFLQSDIQKIEDAIKLDDEIDDLEVEIDRASVRYITLRSPVSSDVRLMFVAMKASHDFERAGDEAHSIAKKARNIVTRDGRVKDTFEIEQMSKIAFSMIEDAITCFVEEDITMAKAIIARDKEVDRLNKSNFSKLACIVPETSENAATNVEIIMISKSIERIADHAKNLADEVIYLLTGE